MLRLRYAFSRSGETINLHEYPRWMPRISLVQAWVVAKTRDEAFQVMGSGQFDPRKQVVLESPPLPAPEALGGEGRCFVQDSSTDHMTIRATLPSASVLLIAENFSKGWRLRSLMPSTQGNYNLLPANYTLMAIPLAAGDHLLRLEYLPKTFVIGKWLSLTAFLLYILAFSFFLLRSRPSL